MRKPDIRKPRITCRNGVYIVECPKIIRQNSQMTDGACGWICRSFREACRLAASRMAA